MFFQRMTNDDFIYQCDLRMNNSIADTLISSRVALFGYSAEKMGEGKALYTDVVEVAERFQVEHADVDVAFKKRDELKGEAHELYSTFIQFR